MIEFVVFLNCICIGIITSLISGLTCFLYIITRKNIIVKSALDFCLYFLGGVVVFLYVLKNYFGKFSVFQIIGFLIGIMLCKNTLQNSFAKFYNMLYNKFIQFRNHKKNKNLIKQEKNDESVYG